MFEIQRISPYLETVGHMEDGHVETDKVRNAGHENDGNEDAEVGEGVANLKSTNT